jgi:hypothetical protein
MIIFDDRYEWSGKKTGTRHPVNWWGGSCRLKIIDLGKSKPGIPMIKPMVIIVQDTGEGSSSKICAPELVKYVCRDFHLDIQKIFWIEYNPIPESGFEVARFQPMAEISEETLFAVNWRPIRPNELEMIKPFCPEASPVKKELDS